MKLLAALLASSTIGSVGGASARRLSYEKVAGYEPGSQVTDHCAIDLDQKSLEGALGGGTDDSFDAAMKVYTEGGNSKSYALVSLTGEDGLTEAVEKGTEIKGKNADGGDVAGKAYSDYDAGTKEIKVQYKTSDVQSQYVKCKVGGLPSADQDMSGCLAKEGNLDIGGTEYPYTYDPETENKNGRTLQGFSLQAKDKMKLCEKGCPYTDFGYFDDYYGTPDYADHWVTSAFGDKATEFTNGNADFSLYGDAGKVEVIKKGTAYMNVFMYVIREFEDAIDDCQAGCIDCNDDPVHAWDEGVCFYTGSIVGQDSPGNSGDGKLLFTLANKRCKNYDTCEENGNSGVNEELFELFSQGKDQLQQGKCDEAKVTTAAVTKLMYIPLVQGTMRYAYKVGMLDGQEKEKAEGAVFAAAVLPKVHAFDADAAKTIYDNMKVGASSTDYAAVKAAFEGVYDDFGITCAQVGGLVQSDGSYYEGMEPCVDGSTEEETPPGEDGEESGGAAKGAAVLAAALLFHLMNAGW